MTTHVANISYLTDIRFGAGALQCLPDVMDTLSMTRPLVVTDAVLRDLGFVDRLGIDSAAVFDGVPTNPTEASVMQGVALFRQAGCNGVIALGGGSPIDCGKCVALLASHDPTLGRYAFIRGGVDHITADQPPVIAIPTTAGTGAEVGRAALITLDSHEKLAIISPHIIPNIAICDPTLTLALPPRLTAATGMDAITHCVETFCSPRVNPVADAIALDGLARAVKHIRRAVTDGTDLTARSGMMMAALQGGLTFQKGLGVVHSLSHPLGTLADKQLHHGMLNAIFLPHATRFNMSACADRMQIIRQTLGLTAADDLPDWFTSLTTDLQLPTCLRDMQATRDDLTCMADLAMQDHCNATNPRPVTIDDVHALYDAAM